MSDADSDFYSQKSKDKIIDDRIKRSQTKLSERTKRQGIPSMREIEKLIPKQKSDEEVKQNTINKYEQGKEENAKGAKQSKITTGVHLLPPKAILEVGLVLEYGAKKYGVNNWKGIPIDDQFKHLGYHYFLALDSIGDEKLTHIKNLICRALFALELLLEQNNNNDTLQDTNDE